MATTSTALADGETFWISAITRAVAMNSATTMRIGMTVQASSTWLLPYTCGGSRPSSFLLLNFATAYTSRLNTIANIAPVTASTNNESPKIEWAGVDAGAKMLVGLNKGVGFANTSLEQQRTRRTGRDRMFQALAMLFRNGAPFLTSRLKIYETLLQRSFTDSIKARPAPESDDARERAKYPRWPHSRFRPTWRACKHHLVPPPAAHSPGARSGTTPAIRLSAGLDSQPDRCFHHLQFAKPAVRAHGSPE